MARTTDRILLGEIGRAQGLKGEVRIRSYTENPVAIGTYGPLQDEDGSRFFELERVRTDGKGLVASIKGIATREAAEALAGTKLYISRSRLPEHAEEEWYHADLIGLAVIDAQGAPVGTVTAVHNFGAGDIIEISPPKGGPSLLVPFTQTAVPEVEVERGWLRVAAPDDFAD